MYTLLPQVYSKWLDDCAAVEPEGWSRPACVSSTPYAATPAFNCYARRICAVSGTQDDVAKYTLYHRRGTCDALFTAGQIDAKNAASVAKMQRFAGAIDGHVDKSRNESRKAPKAHTQVRLRCKQSGRLCNATQWRFRARNSGLEDEYSCNSCCTVCYTSRAQPKRAKQDTSRNSRC